MCGICGIIDKYSEIDNSGAIVQQMVHKLHHRGPDHQAVVLSGQAALGHARLSIIDVSALAHQPMNSTDGRFILVYNGEIYNFKELRQLLSTNGLYPRSQSDTEVLLLLWQLYGKDCLARLNGMFAFAIWDKEKAHLTLARDRFGQKPLYYAINKGRISFASELQALMCDPNLERKANLNAIYHYLTVQSVPAPLCAYEGINKLSPGNILEWDGVDAQISKYWKPHFIASFLGTEAEALEELDARLSSAVHSHLVSDVPIGLFLSGGVDSSLITALACRTGSNLHTFAMGFAESSFDERPYAQEVAELYFTIHHEGMTPSDILNLIPEIVVHYGEPFADSSAIPTWYLAKMTRQHVTVALSGDGGDDLFGGYERHLNPFIYAHNVSPKVEILYQELDAILKRNVSKDFCAAMLNPAIAKYYSHWARIWGPLKEKLCSSSLRENARPPLSLCLMLEHFANSSHKQALDSIQAFELEYYLACTLMTKVDIASMHFSLEVRAPFLDNAVADLALSLPRNFRVEQCLHKNGGSYSNGFETKALLKKLACRYLPEALVYRRKMGFGLPLGTCLRQEKMCSWMYDTLFSMKCRQRGWLNMPIVELLVKEHMTEKCNHQQVLWTLLMLEEWALHCLDE